MAPSKLTEKQVAQLVSWIAVYIQEQRDAYRGKARPIGREHNRLLGSFFPAGIFENVWVIRGQVREPSFYSQLPALGIRNAPAFSQMEGITFRDVVVHVGPLTDSLLFHELVHAVQYQHLGVNGFADRYVRGFLSGGSYEEIPLEKQAYELEGRFSADSSTAFSVEDEVKERFGLNRL